MKTLTVNQIVVLLDIYRGCDTQENGTYSTDLMVLLERKLIIKQGKSWDTTITGNKLVQEMKSMTIINPL